MKILERMALRHWKKRILQDTDLDQWNALKEKHSATDFGYKKYFDLPLYLDRDVSRALRLRKALKNGGRVVDLGSGTGLFPYCCQHMGISTLSVQPTFADKAYSEMFTDTHAFFKVERLDEEIKPNETVPIPEAWQPVAAVTASQLQFNKIGRGDRSPEVLPHERYGINEWSTLLKGFADMAGPDGLYVEFRFNKPDCWDVWYVDEVKDFFESLGGNCDGPHVIIHGLTSEKFPSEKA